MVHNFENFGLLEAKDQTLEKGLKLLNAKSVAEYYILDIPNRPKALQKTVFIYVPKTKRFGMCERKENLGADDFVSLEISGGDIEEPHFTTTNPQDILNIVKLHQTDDKGLSEEAFLWLEEEIMSEDTTWEAAVNRYLTTAKEVKDSDYKVLGKKKEDYATRRTSYRFGL